MFQPKRDNLNRAYIEAYFVCMVGRPQVYPTRGFSQELLTLITQVNQAKLDRSAEAIFSTLNENVELHRRMHACVRAVLPPGYFVLRREKTYWSWPDEMHHSIDFRIVCSQREEKRAGPGIFPVELILRIYDAVQKAVTQTLDMREAEIMRIEEPYLYRVNATTVTDFDDFNRRIRRRWAEAIVDTAFKLDWYDKHAGRHEFIAALGAERAMNLALALFSSEAIAEDPKHRLSEAAVLLLPVLSDCIGHYGSVPNGNYPEKALIRFAKKYRDSELYRDLGLMPIRTLFRAAYGVRLGSVSDEPLQVFRRVMYPSDELDVRINFVLLHLLKPESARQIARLSRNFKRKTDDHAPPGFTGDPLWLSTYAAF